MLVDVLRDQGYVPDVEGDGTIRLRNCPFHALVAEHRGLTCATNLALLGGVTSALPDAGVSAEPVDVPGDCCVALVPR
jgi:predicted ArsR family transcriptional regulator